jgi:phosphoenolpyruvate---glycerone phosphotransferase subunit DhaL
MTKESFRQMIAGAASSIRAHHALLSELDSVAGDGDHGATMLRIMESLERSVASGASTDLHACLREAGWDVLGVDGGAASSIVGAFFLGIGEGPETGAMATLFEAGLAAVRRHTNANIGDKTMMDALMPAVKALHDAASSGKSEAEAVRCAARAAQAGAESTKSMTSRHGRAKFAGERTRGHADPGATSIALLFEGFSNGIDKFLEGAPNGGHG